MTPLLEVLNLLKCFEKRRDLRREVEKISAQLPILIIQSGLIAAVAWYLEKSEVFSKPQNVKSKKDKLAYLVSIEPILRITATNEKSKKLENLVSKLLNEPSSVSEEDVKITVGEAFKDLFNLTKKPDDYARAENIAVQYAIHLKRVFEAGGERI